MTAVAEHWAPATAGNVRAGDTIRVRGIWRWRELAVRGVGHDDPGRPVTILTATGATWHAAAGRPVLIRDSRRYNRGP